MKIAKDVAEASKEGGGGRAGGMAIARLAVAPPDSTGGYPATTKYLTPVIRVCGHACAMTQKGRVEGSRF